MLTGDLPYTGESPVTVALKHIGDPVPAIDVRATGVSPALAAIVNRLLQKNPERRFQSASDLASALREARERPTVAGFRISNDAPSASPGRGSLPPRRSPMPDHSYERADERDRGRAGMMIAALLLALLAATAIGYAVFTHPWSAMSGQIAVADYTGMTQAQAQQAVVNAGLRTRFTKSASETVGVDHVIRQSPPAGTSVPRNQIVELVISNGKPVLGLEDVRGYSVNDAQRTLQGQGFAVTLVRHYDNTLRDNVINQKPAAGAKVPEGSRITLIVSDGPAPVLVPNFVGMPVEKAQARASALGIALDTSQTVAGNPANAIASQSVAPGTKVTANTTVHVIVNSGMPLNAPPAPNGPPVAVPNLIGSPYASALDALKSAGLSYKVLYAVSEHQQRHGRRARSAAGTRNGRCDRDGHALGFRASSRYRRPAAGPRPCRACGGRLQHAAVSQYTTARVPAVRSSATEPRRGTDLAPGIVGDARSSTDTAVIRRRRCAFSASIRRCASPVTASSNAANGSRSA